MIRLIITRSNYRWFILSFSNKKKSHLSVITFLVKYNNPSSIPWIFYRHPRYTKSIRDTDINKILFDMILRLNIRSSPLYQPFQELLNIYSYVMCIPPANIWHVKEKRRKKSPPISRVSHHIRSIKTQARTRACEVIHQFPPTARKKRNAIERSLERIVV